MSKWIFGVCLVVAMIIVSRPAFAELVGSIDAHATVVVAVGVLSAGRVGQTLELVGEHGMHVRALPFVEFLPGLPPTFITLPKPPGGTTQMILEVAPTQGTLVDVGFFVHSDLFYAALCEGMAGRSCRYLFEVRH